MCSPIFISRTKRTLPLKRWFPYAINSKSRFWMTYLFDSAASYIIILSFVAIETLMANLLQEICGQLDILINRLFQLSNNEKNFKEKYFYEKDEIRRHESDLIKKCIDHHISIFL